MTRRARSASWIRFAGPWLCLCVLGAVLPLLAASPGADLAETHRIFRWRPFLAPFHAVVLHFPIGFLTVAFILEIDRMRRPQDDTRRVIVLVVWLSLLTGIISATLGLLRAGTGDYDPHAVELHRAFGLAIPIFTIVTLVLQRSAYRHESMPGWTYAYRGLLTLTLTLIVVAGHSGGNLTHGSKYLVENAPEFVRELIEDAPVAPEVAGDGARNERERLYTDKVRPIFASKCYSCHGEEKQKSGYRLDQPALSLKGGKSGNIAIKPFDPVESYLVRLILLPPQHDDVMPPEGKEPLTLEEIMTIVDWIRNGAVFPGAAVAVPPGKPSA